MKFKQFILYVVLGFLLFPMAHKSYAQYSEYEIKAAYIFNFAKFIVWPENTPKNDTIYLGIFGTDPFGTVLEKTLLGRKAQGKEWKIIRTSNLQDLFRCHIIFISEIGKSDMLSIIERTNGLPVLTLGDELYDFCEMGGIINFTPQFSEQQFEINNESAITKGIKISPKLLLLAKVISNKEDEF